MKTKIAIIGYGFVGRAVEFGFKNNTNEIMIVDPYEGYNNIDDLKYFKPEFVFVCVPTPMGEDGHIDATTVSNVTKLLSDLDCTVIIKSTITPDVVLSLCSSENIVYNPEFLTERNSFEDFLKPKFHVLGGDAEYTEKVKNLYTYNSNCNPAPFHLMRPEEASLVKYGINSFLAMKVVWFNQWKDLVESIGARYNVVSNSIGEDDRIGHSHMKVPGIDGKRGFGGSCFPKDTSAIFNYAKENGTDMSVLLEVMHANAKYRMKYDLDDREKEQRINFKMNDKDGQ